MFPWLHMDWEKGEDVTLCIKWSDTPSLPLDPVHSLTFALVQDGGCFFMEKSTLLSIVKNVPELAPSFLPLCVCACVHVCVGDRYVSVFGVLYVCVCMCGLLCA